MNYKEVFGAKYERISWLKLLHDVFQSKAQFVNEPYKINVSSQLAKVALYLGKITLSPSEELAVYEVELANSVDIVRNRRGIRDMLTSDWRNQGYVGAFVLSFRKKESILRFSYISEIWGFDDKNEFVKTSTDTKRFTYLLGEGYSCRTAVEQFQKLRDSDKTLADVTAAFNVEALSKEFYNRLYQWYEWAMSAKAGISFPINPKASSDERESMNIKIIRLITRLLFVWFIKQKHLVPDRLFNPNYLKTVLKGFDKDSSTDGCYYNAILQNLFFATLNCPIRDDDDNNKPLRTFASNNPKDKRDTRNKYRYAEMFSIGQEQVIEMFEQVPFLNGGLFDCLDKPQDLYLDLDHDILHDGFSRNATKNANGKHKYRAFVPNNLFFSEDEKQPGLITLLNEYNFTIEENSTDDAEISLDPELLGCVFENLLAAYNPETQESARKSTGSFYTPRVVVDYMVDEALIAYLAGQNIAGIKEGDLRQLFRSHEKIGKWSESQIEAIEQALERIKILDPACGSGAFPMGCLLRIVGIMETLYGGEINRYEKKLAIIENCIYGSDIQSIAMLICKLRFFISLICEQKDDEIDFSKPESNFGVRTLPNLETKFVAANSLVSAAIRKYERGQIELDFDGLRKTKKELLKIREQHFQAKKRSIKRKCQEADKAKRKEIYDYLVNTLYNPNESFIAERKAEIERQKALLKSLEGKVYLDELDAVKQTDLFGRTSLFSRDINEDKRRDADRRIKNLEAEIEKERAKAGLKGFDAAIKQLTDWDPYDQNSVSPFFDPEWMFCLDDKFDIVIGNPPYIQLQQNHGELSQLYAGCNYETFDGTGDIYCLFYERGYQLLKSGGHLCYITSNKWMRSGYGKKTRNFFASKTNPKRLIDFAGVKVFNSATVDTNILLLSKSANEHKTLCAVTSNQNKDSLGNLSLFVEQRGMIHDFPDSNSWAILSPIEQSIKRKIESVGTPLKDWEIDIYRGVLTGCNEAFIISSAKRDEILSNCQSEDERIRTEELIRPILRGREIKRYKYKWAGLWLINTHNGLRGKLPRIDINNYPAVKKWLDYGGIAYNGKPYKGYEQIKNRADQGETPYNLRNCAYLDLFFRPKICWKAVGRNLAFAIVEAGTFVTAPACFLSAGYKNDFILAFLCSKVGQYFIYKNSDTTGAGDIMLNVQSLIKFPIPQTYSEELHELCSLMINSPSNGTQKSIDSLIYQIYGLQQDEIQEIEKY